MAFVVVAPTALRGGWPHNHDMLSSFERVEAFRREFVAGDYFPLWAPFAFDGHGSPMPLLYHRLFNTVAGLFAIAMGSVRATQFTLVLSLAMGALGMSAAAKVLGCSRWIRLFASAMLLISTYTYTDWLLRGSMAELTAGMIFTWLLVICLRIPSRKPFGLALGAAMVAMFYAHTMVFMYSSITVLSAVACELVSRRRELGATLKYLGRGVGIATACILVFAGPYVTAIAIGGRNINVERVRIFRPENELRPLREYLVNDFEWGHTSHGLSIELGRFLLGALLVSAVVVLVFRRRLQVDVRQLIVLLLPVCAYALLQAPFAAGFYVSVPMVGLIQFPWRLLLFITPLVILLTAILNQSISGTRRAGPFIAAGILASALLAQTLFIARAYRGDYSWFSRAEMEEALSSLDGPRAAGEFLPIAVHDRVPPRTPLFLMEGCHLLSSSPPLDSFERIPFQSIDMALESTDGCIVRFSQFATPLIDIRTSEGGHVATTKTQTVAIALPAGRADVHVSRVGFFQLLARGMGRR